MNKFYTLLLLSGAVLSVNAQQINGSFDAEWGKCVPWTSKGNTNAVGTTPKGWAISNVYISKGITATVGSEIEGNNGGKAVKLTNINAAGQAVPAYIALGTPWATAEVKNFMPTNADGGTWGGKKFTYHPDALSFDYKRDNSNGAENATVVAYLWNGTWTQKDVPGNTSIVGAATKVDMVDRDRNVLGMEKTNAVLGGDVTSTEGATCVAKINYAITGNTKKPLAEGEKDKNEYEWVSDTIDFDYGDNVDAKVEKINVIFSATNYFGDRKHIVKNNSLSIDNVKLIYWHALSELTFDGKAVEGFDAEKTEYTVKGNLADDNSKIAYKVKGKGAKASTSLDLENNVLKITVEGNDISVNADSKTVYTIHFDNTTVGIGSISANEAKSHKVYTLGGVRVNGKPAAGMYIVDGKKTIVK